MSTKHTTTTDSTQHQNNAFNQQYQFDPTALGLYQQSNKNLQQNVLPQLQSISSSPFNNPWFNTNLQQGNQYASQVGSRSMQNTLAAARAQGVDYNSPAGTALLQRQMRTNSGLQSQSWLNAVNQAHNDMWNALNMQGQLASMRPLQTGASGTGSSDSTGHSTQVEQTSGLGTWLPAVAGLGMTALGGFGAAGMLGSGIKAGMSGAGSGMSGALGGMLGSMSGITPQMPSMGTMPMMSDNYGYGSPSPFSGSMMPTMYDNSSPFMAPVNNIVNSSPSIPSMSYNPLSPSGYYQPQYSF